VTPEGPPKGPQEDQGQRSRAAERRGRPRKVSSLVGSVAATLAGELWNGLSPEERQQVAKLCPDRRFGRGKVIFAPGDPPDGLYVLTSGLVALSHLSQDGQESILRVFGPGDVFGELFLTVRARPFRATALTACVVTVIPPRRSFACCPPSLL
jgi:CRP-like cAMP-binding protein